MSPPSTELGEDTLPGEFSASISRDAEGVQAIGRGLESLEVQQFMDILEQCQGQVFMSGIGKSAQANLSYTYQ
jgi:hypothetical protein